MIVYHPKKWRGFSVLCGSACLRGSVFLQSLPYGIVAGTIALAIKLDQTHDWGIFNGRFGHTVREESFFDHPYSLQIWATSLGFLLVFRGNLAYARYWEGRMQLARMCSYYQDAATVSRPERTPAVLASAGWLVLCCVPLPLLPSQPHRAGQIPHPQSAVVPTPTYTSSVLPTCLHTERRVL
jgi:hypothetical protein